MSFVPIKSIFQEITEWAFTTANLEDVKAETITFVQSKNINNTDKTNIIKSIEECKTIVRFQTYIANSLLKYEGLGSDRMMKEYKPHR
jgi:hypothetical protein